MPQIQEWPSDPQAMVELAGLLQHPETLHALEPRSREYLASLLGRAISTTIPLPELDDRNDLETLRSEGIVTFPNRFSENQIRNIHQFFGTRPVFNAHVPGASDQVPRWIGEGAEAFKFGSYAGLDTFLAPHLIERFTAPETLSFMANYLGGAPTLYSLNTWWSFPRGGVHPKVYDGQTFHRDFDSLKTCTMFIYLTEVDEESGPHTYIRKTHRVDTMKTYLENHPEVGTTLADFFNLKDDGYADQDFYQESLSPLITDVWGSAGTLMAADSFGLHKGTHPKRRPRLAVWARYCMRVTTQGILEAAGHGSLSPADLGDRYPEDPLARYALRGFVK